jgi:hypothetical protein
MKDSFFANTTPFATPRRTIITPTATPGTSSCHTAAPSRTSQTDSIPPVVSSPTSGIASTATPLSALYNMHTPIPIPQARAIISNSLWTRATERNQRQPQWQWQMQAVSTPRSVVSGSCSIYRFGHSDMMRLVFARGRLLVLYMWDRRLFMSASDLETVSDNAFDGVTTHDPVTAQGHTTTP